MKTSFHCEVNKIGCLQSRSVSQHAFFVKFNYMTTSWCLSLCSSRSANYAGLKSGDTCVCAQDLMHFAQLQYTKCPSYCKGGIETCGGADAVTAYRIVSPCFLGGNFPLNLGNSKFLGCFRQAFSFEEENHIYRTNLSSHGCILFCNMLKLPLAILDQNSGCMCGQFNGRFNLTNKLDCNQIHIKVYRTFSEDARCASIRLLPPGNYKKAVLATFPGSGNTWTRYLLERATGVYTGSVYGDRLLHEKGFLGEFPFISRHRSVVVKDHMLTQNTMSLYQSAILIIRNPYDAMIADFHRYASKGNHTGIASNERFQSEGFQVRFKYVSSTWLNLIKWVVLSGKPYLLVNFEELANHPIATTLKMVEFLQMHTVISPDNLQQRILCLSQQLNGDHKRRKHKLTIDPFTNSMKHKFNNDILQACKHLDEHGIRNVLSEYERDIL
ncbi:unnamed protein product [Clavelina lepadiformis]|uniref:WSC domain-containing protein n=1 Tax=Clavelina lepadiformis TaxID=159417 RepID=A0ABP0GFV7_CLALP